MAKRIKGLKENCIGCRTCLLACSLNMESVFNPKRARLRVKSEHGGVDEPLICRQCDDADCAEVCPTEAIQRNHDTGVWLVDNNACTGCEACIDACPYDAIFMDLSGEYPIKCEVCENMSCKEYCPNEALVLEG